MYTALSSPPANTETKQVAGAAAPRPKMGEKKLIIRSEKVRFIDILSLLLLRRPITSYHFVETGDQTAADVGSTPGEWIVALTELIQNALVGLYYPAKLFGVVLEFFLNFVALNGGLLGIIWNIFRCKLVIPFNREAPNFRSFLAFIDGRTELKPGKPQQQLRVVDLESGEATNLESGGCAAAPLIGQPHDDSGMVLLGDLTAMDISIMAAKIAYENAAYIENVVNNAWKYNFVGFYSCWNKFIQSETTQAFVMTDRGKDAGVLVLAFRGTEPFNMQDWSTDVNLSWLGMGAMGNVHAGFLKALGLQEEDGKDANRAFPRDAPDAADGKKFAYYELRTVLREQLKKHPRAQLIITGHSLGGALAVVFPALLALHGETDILGRLFTVQTYGQPRVGDSTFTKFFSTSTSKANTAFLRMVYRYDIVPRVPFDVPPVAEYAHGGQCVYFDGWYKWRVLAGDAPNPNYFDPRYLLSMYGNAWGDLFKGMFLWVKEGRDYREGAVSLLYRASGLLLPGIASHSPRDYLNAVRLGHVVPKKV